MNSTISALARGPFNAIEEFKGEYRCIAADLRNANDGQSSGPLEIDRPWDAHTDDHIGLMDHLGIDRFTVMGFCIENVIAFQVQLSNRLRQNTSNKTSNTFRKRCPIFSRADVAHGILSGVSWSSSEQLALDA